MEGHNTVVVLDFVAWLVPIKFIHNLDTNCQILMKCGFMECVMEGHNTMVVLDFVAWLVPKLCCRVQHGNGSAEIKCGDDSWTHCTMTSSA